MGYSPPTRPRTLIIICVLYELVQNIPSQKEHSVLFFVIASMGFCRQAQWVGMACTGQRTSLLATLSQTFFKTLGE